MRYASLAICLVIHRLYCRLFPIRFSRFRCGGQGCVVVEVVGCEVIDAVFGGCYVAQASIVEHTLKAEVFVDGGPMDAAIGEVEVPALEVGGAS